MKKRAVMLGAGSDIGAGVVRRFVDDGWEVVLRRHDDDDLLLQAVPAWDLIVCCYGVLEPIGNFWDVDFDDWLAAFEANAFKGLRQVQMLYPQRRPGASVCFFSGAGANGPAPTYSAYCASKILLTKMVELMDAESEDCKFFILGPGMMRTKIQEQTLRAGARAANFDRVRDFMESGALGTDMDYLYKFLMACVAAPKAAVGGCNFYVPQDDPARLADLGRPRDWFKLRRAGDEAIRRCR